MILVLSSENVLLLVLFVLLYICWQLLQSLISYLDCWTGDYRDDVALKTAIMGFINAALKYGPGQVHIRNVFSFNLTCKFMLIILLLISRVILSTVLCRCCVLFIVL